MFLHIFHSASVKTTTLYCLNCLMAFSVSFQRSSFKTLATRNEIFSDFRFMLENVFYRYVQFVANFVIQWNDSIEFLIEFLFSTKSQHCLVAKLSFKWCYLSLRLKRSLEKEMKRLSIDDYESKSLSKHWDREWARMHLCIQFTGWKSFRFMNNFVSFQMKYLSRTKICFYIYWCRTKYQLEFPFPFPLTNTKRCYERNTFFVHSKHNIDLFNYWDFGFWIIISYKYLSNKS